MVAVCCKTSTHQKQLAMVRTHFFEIRVAEQMCSEPWRMLACQGHWPTVACRPEAIPDVTAGRPQTANTEEEKGLEALPRSRTLLPSPPALLPQLPLPQAIPAASSRPPPAEVPYLTAKDSSVFPFLHLEREEWGT